ETPYRWFHETLCRRESQQRALLRRLDHHSNRFGESRRKTPVGCGSQWSVGCLGVDREESSRALPFPRTRILSRRIQRQRRPVDGLYDQRHGDGVQYASSEKGRSSPNAGRSLETSLEWQIDNGQPVLRMVWNHSPIYGRGSRTALHEATE